MNGPHTGTGLIRPLEVAIDTHDAQLDGDLAVPPAPAGIVIFAHGSGSSRHSPRNRAVADYLNHHRMATLLFDLLTQEEELAERHTRHLRFDIQMLARRLTATVDWLIESGPDSVTDLPIGLFGASTGAAAALVTAAARPQALGAVVSRGGRPDLAGAALREVRAPTLLIIGSLDQPVIHMNQDAAARMTCDRQIQIVPGATHLFEEPGTLDRVAVLAADWFEQHLRR